MVLSVTALLRKTWVSI